MRRFGVGLLLVVAMFSSTVGTLFAAGTTGTLSGTITDSKTGLPIAAVMVNAVSPTGSYKATTDSKGFFSLAGVNPDTYSVSFQLTGYESLTITGVTVSNDTTADVSSKLNKSLTTIGKVTVRGAGGAFQPKQTQDTYTVTTQQINTLLGSPDATSETNLLVRLPGASLDRYGYPVLRGGRENEEGFEFDGIPLVDAFTSQFTNSLQLNGNIAQLSLTPGAGDVTTGGSGTGSINIIPKRGAYPAFGSINVQVNADPYSHQLNLEYGFATPNGKVSNYASFVGLNAAYAQYGEYGTAAQSLSQGVVLAPSTYVSRDILDNFVYKFGKGNSQSFQILYDNQISNFLGVYGGYGNLGFTSTDPYALANYIKPYTQLSTSQIQQYTSLLPFQTSLTDNLAAENRGAENNYQPNNTIKFQYSNNLSSSSFITAKFYELDSVSTFDYANEGGVGSIYALQGGHRDGGTIDFTTQLGSKHVIQAGGEYDFLKPTYDETDPFDGLLLLGAFGSNLEIGDFVPNGGNCPTDNFLGTKGGCGYLASQGISQGSIPYLSEQAVDVRQDTAFYLRDKYTPNDKTVIDYGLRFEGSNVHYPAVASGCNPTVAQVAADAAFSATGNTPDNCEFAPTGFTSQTYGGSTYSVPFVNVTNEQKKPFLIEPRAAISFQLTKNDSVRASYGRSVEFAPLAFNDVTGAAGVFSRYAGVPSYSIFSQAADGNAYTCGVTGNLRCQNYADQIRWEFQNNGLGVPQQPVKPETFNNYEFSYSHQFPAGVGVKITPFYRRGYDALALVSSPRLVNGQPVIDPASGSVELLPAVTTNLGQSRTTGVEFYLTKEATYGLSGTVSATYINEFSNVIPTPLIQEDFFPSIPTPSLDLGNQYRVGFVSPFSATAGLSYKMHNGLNFNPIVQYERGYPTGVGNLSAQFINGKAYNILNTNAANAATFGSQNYAPNFLDPSNPGSLFAPNVAATRGTPETASAGGFLSDPRINLNFAIGYNPPGSHNTFTVYVTNIFNQVYSQVPSYNSRYQPVATGISGIKTGTTTAGISYPGEGLGSYGTSQFGQDPYRILNSSAPTNVRLTYTLAL
jgi:hypothetical protein